MAVVQEVETSREEPLDCRLIPLEPQWVWRPMVSVAQAAATLTWELRLLVLNLGTEVPRLRILLEVAFLSVGQAAQLQLPEVAEPRVEVQDPTVWHNARLEAPCAVVAPLALPLAQPLARSVLETLSSMLHHQRDVLLLRRQHSERSLLHLESLAA